MTQAVPNRALSSADDVWTEQPLRSIAEALWQPAFIVTCRGELAHANQAARRLFSPLPRWLPTCACQHPGTPPRWVHAVHVGAVNGGPAFDLVLPALHEIDPDQAHDAPWARRWRLPPRLARVAVCLVRGRSDKEIAADLGLEFQTVRTYVKQLYRRLDLHSRAELIHAVYGWNP